MDRREGRHAQRYSVLDSYRFIAALGIVAYHFEAHFGVFLPHPTHWLDAFQTLVDFFFVLSGFVLMHTYGARIRSLAAYGDFLRKRFARVYPLHAATLMLCVLLYVVVKLAAIPVRDPSIIDMSLFVPNLFLVQAWGITDHPGLDSPSWSISAEAFVYLLFPLFVLIATRLKPVLALGVAILVAGLIESGRAAAGLPSGALATYDFGMLRAVPMFLAGIAVHLFVTARPARPLSWLLPHGLFAAILVLMVVQAPLYAIDLLYPLLVGLIAMAERGGRPTVLQAKPMVRLGDTAFAIYMIHTFVQIACVGLVRHLGLTSRPDLILVALGGTLLTILVGLASCHFLERPMRRKLAGSRIETAALAPAPCATPEAV